jgi:pyruvate, orthophosphate dikinase
LALEAAIVANKQGKSIDPKIMIPMVCSVREMDYLVGLIHDCIDGVELKHNYKLKYSLGCMIETPRACLCSDLLADPQRSQFFSFGSNDLTQMIFGISRTDTQLFLVLQLFF